MSYNIHPIFVHFPIALLCVYSIVAIIPFKKWFPQISWKQIERVLLVIGVLGAFVALATGETAEHLTQPDRQLVEMHSLFAGISTWVYGILLIAEIFVIITPFLESNQFLQKAPSVFKKVIARLGAFFTQRVVLGVLAFIGFIAISITGLLGGVLVYGLTADPFAGIVLKMLGLN